MSAVLVEPFPQVGALMMRAYADLGRVEQAKTLDEVRDLGPLELLARPWDLTSCRDAGLRREVWCWLDAVVGWINTQHAWATDSLVPPCWPRHPHLVHEIGCLADQRRRAGLAVTSELLEEWHRYGLPQFLDRLHTRTHGACEDGHKNPPGATRTRRYLAPAAVGARQELFTQDVAAATGPQAGRAPLVLVDGLLVDPTTGEVLP